MHKCCGYCQLKICSTADTKSVQTAVGGRGIEYSSPWRYLPATHVQTVAAAAASISDGSIVIVQCFNAIVWVTGRVYDCYINLL